MRDNYKIVISNRKIYKEIELPQDATKVSIGTNINCDIRLAKDLFFEAFELIFQYVGDSWQVFCSDNVYVTTGESQKLIVKKLQHGDEISLKYQESNVDILKLSYMLDFGFEKSDYELCIDISNVKEVGIGGNSKCQIYLESQYVKDDYVVITKKNNDYYVIEKNTRYGVYINGVKKTGEILIKDTDFVALAEYSFYLKGNCLYTSKNSNAKINGLNVQDVSYSKSQQQYPHYNRSTRLRNVVPEEGIGILDPTPEPNKPTGNIVMQLLPAIIMFVVTIIFRVVLKSSSGGSNNLIWVSLISMLLGIVTSTVSIVTDRKKYKDAVKERNENYNRYIAGKREEIEQSRQYEKELLDDIYYSLEDEIQIVNDFSSDLFNRSVQDKDFLEIRMGVGRRVAERKIDYKQQEKFEGADPLAGIPADLSVEYRELDNAPITIDLKEKNAIGIVGNRENLYGILKNMTIDIAVRQYYKDVKVFYILNDEYQDKLKWLRYLPHLNNDDLMIRNIVCDSDSKNILFEYLYKELTRRSANDKVAYTQLIVFVYNDLGIKRHPISRFIQNASKMNVTFVFFDENKDFLPDICDDVVVLENEQSGKIFSAQNALDVKAFEYHAVSDEIAEKIVLKLAPVYCDEVSLEGTLTKNISMFEMLNILNAEDIDLQRRWDNSMVYKSLAAPLGVKAKNQIVYLDLNEKKHGPHGLVAGTTGSGKSEILQSYILSMATLFHPYEVGFVIIDFKGGGMVNQFKDLPHLIGAITNIDGREINRSLLSIKAELKKRQALFAEYGVNHIDSYIKLFKKGEAKIPLPHLILIVDEFAELKMDQPEFMKELISAARIGRSLGVHLILATQKPSGVVDAQIWSNSKFKLCLKVQNKEDSNEVLKTPLAAEIKEPGRAYLQVGNNEIFELFQSAYSGGPASVDDSVAVKKFDVSRVNLSGRRTVIYSQRPEKSNDVSETQLDSIVNHIAAYCNAQGIKKLPGICLPPLGELYGYDMAKAIQREGNEIKIPIGIFDDPNSQRQEQLELNMSESNTFILGSSQSGKTGLLQTIIRGLAKNYTPKEVNIYILDFASMALKVFDNLRHVGGVVVPGDDEKAKLFFRMMEKEVASRKAKFSQMGITSYQSYRDAGNTDLPQIVILLDNLVAFRELCDAYDEKMLSLCREGVAVGISVVVTAQQISGIGYKYLSTFANKYGLSCNDKSEYGTLFERCRMEPKNVPGRALTSIDKTIYEFQTYLAFEGEKEIQRVEAIKAFIETRNNECQTCMAFRIPEIPATLTHNYLEQNYGKTLPNEYYMGMDFDSVEPRTLSFMKDGYLAISGVKDSGKSNYIRYIFSCMQKRIFENPIEAYVVDGFEQKLAGLKEYGFVEEYTTDAGTFEIILDKIQSICEKRAEKCSVLGNAFLEEEPYIVVVVNNDAVYDSSKISKDAYSQWKNIIKTYKNMKVMFIFDNVENAAIGYSANEILKHIKDAKNILFFGELAAMKIVDTPASVARQFKSKVERGDAFYITGSGVTKLRTPLCEEE